MFFWLLLWWTLMATIGVVDFSSVQTKNQRERTGPGLVSLSHSTWSVECSTYHGAAHCSPSADCVSWRNCADETIWSADNTIVGIIYYVVGGQETNALKRNSVYNFAEEEKCRPKVNVLGMYFRPNARPDGMKICNDLGMMYSFLCTCRFMSRDKLAPHTLSEQLPFKFVSNFSREHYTGCFLLH